MEIPFEIKAIDHEKGSFVAYGSTFGNEDLGGDVVVKGAFKKSLNDIPASEVYMFYNHDSKEIIGQYTHIEEDEHGLKIEGKLFIDDIARAKETHFLMKKGLIKKFSIGFQIIKKTFDKGRRMLEEIKLIEISPVTFPMNPEAELLGVKNMNTKGSNLARLLNDKIDSMVEAGESRAEIVRRMGSAAGISTDTVNAILSQEINQPPKERISAFARVLSVSSSDLSAATEKDKNQKPRRSSTGDHGKELTIRQFEEKLRDVGFSRKESEAISAKGFTGLQRDVAGEEQHEEKADWSEVIKHLKDIKL